MPNPVDVLVLEREELRRAACKLMDKDRERRRLVFDLDVRFEGLRQLAKTEEERGLLDRTLGGTIDRLREVFHLVPV
jgi:hypothetical protein